MGIRDALRPLETDTERTSVLDAQGCRVGSMPRGFGVVDPGDVEIHRGDLAHLLYELTRDGVDYRFGDSVVALDDRGHRVDVLFESGARETFDLVVGADGVHSRTRDLAFKRPVPLAPLGLWMAIFTAPNFLKLDREQLLVTQRRRIASVKSANGNRELKVCLFFGSPEERFEDLDEAGQRAAVARAYADAGWEFPRLLAAMKDAGDFYCDVTCQVRMDRHVVGRVALVGDAGFCPSPLSGQGTSLALVGAYVLANELAAIKREAQTGEILAALARYDAAMRPFVVHNQDLVLKIAKGFLPVSGFDVWLRTAAMKLMRFLPSAWINEMMMGPVRVASRAIELPG